MSRVAYVNGEYVPLHHAMVGMEDRGYQFSDGIYEVMEVRAGQLMDLDGHWSRWERSAREIEMASFPARALMEHWSREVIERSHLSDCCIYWQMTRGLAPRNHGFPKPAVRPVLTLYPIPAPRRLRKTYYETGVPVITVEDRRWGRCDIKSISLLGNILAKQQAKECGAFEAIFVSCHGTVREGSSMSCFMVDRGGVLWTHPESRHILPGITRQKVLEVAKRDGIPVREEAYSLEDWKSAAEAFVTSTTMHVLPVTKSDDAPVGNGTVGPVTRRVLAAYEKQYGAFCHG